MKGIGSKGPSPLALRLENERKSVSSAPRNRQWALLKGLKEGKLDPKAAYQLLDDLGRMHGTGVRQNRSVVRALSGPVATQALRELAEASQKDEKLRKTLVDYAVSRLERTYGTIDPDKVAQRISQGKNVERLTPFEWSFALLRFDAGKHSLRDSVARNFLRVGMRDGRVDMLRSPDIRKLVDYLTPLSLLQGTSRLPTDDPLRDRLYRNLSPKNPLVEQFVAGKLEQRDAQGVIAWLMAAHRDRDKKISGPAGRLLADLLVPPEGQFGKVSAQRLDWLREHSSRQLTEQFGTNNILDPSLTRLIDEKTVGRLSPIQWAMFFMDDRVDDKLTEAQDKFRLHVVRCLKKSGVDWSDLMPVIVSSKPFIGASVNPALRPHLERLLNMPPEPNRVLQKKWIQEMLACKDWSRFATWAIRRGDLPSNTFAAMLDLFCDLAEGRSSVLSLWGPHPEAFREEIAELMQRARSVLSTVVSQAPGNPALLARLVAYGESRYPEGLGALLEQLGSGNREDALIGARLAESLSPLAVFYAVSQRQTGRDKTVESVVGHFQRSEQIKGELADFIRALRGNNVSELLKHYRNDDSHRQQLWRKVMEPLRWVVVDEKTSTDRQREFLEKIQNQEHPYYDIRDGFPEERPPDPDYFKKIQIRENPYYNIEDNFEQESQYDPLYWENIKDTKNPYYGLEVGHEETTSPPIDVRSLRRMYDQDRNPFYGIQTVDPGPGPDPSPEPQEPAPEQPEPEGREESVPLPPEKPSPLQNQGTEWTSVPRPLEGETYIARIPPDIVRKDDE